jgi:hypothetical protein
MHGKGRGRSRSARGASAVVAAITASRSLARTVVERHLVGAPNWIAALLQGSGDWRVRIVIENQAQHVRQPVRGLCCNGVPVAFPVREAAEDPHATRKQLYCSWSLAAASPPLRDIRVSSSDLANSQDGRFVVLGCEEDFEIPGITIRCSRKGVCDGRVRDIAFGYRLCEVAVEIVRVGEAARFRACGLTAPNCWK